MHRDWTFAAAQADMRRGYAAGAPGVVVSGVVWLAAGLTVLYRTPHAGVLALLAGGMLIHPLTVLALKAAGRPGAHGKGNPLGTLALEGTVWMLLGIVLAYGLSRWHITLFFPAMLAVIGGRYLTFATVYGMAHYRVFGATLALAAIVLAYLGAASATAAFMGGAIELLFAALIHAGQPAPHTVQPPSA